MPNPATIMLPKPNDPYEFENMVTDVLSKIYFSEFQTYGRRGQKQQGVDILTNSSFDIVAQCKNHILTANDINKILSNLILDRNIKHFIIATSMDCDTNIQSCVTDINCKKNYPFDISIMFWNNIVSILYQYPELYKKYYAINTNCTTIEDIKIFFNNAIQKYQIPFFLMRDIFVDGIPMDLPTNVEIFSKEVTELLYNNLTLQNEPIYKSILSFCTMLDDLNGFLATKLFPVQGLPIYRYCPNYSIDEDTVRKNIQDVFSKSIKELDRLYSNVNLGMTLFP